jgi:ABC-type amino acid transport substrate-binding protein
MPKIAVIALALAAVAAAAHAAQPASADTLQRIIDGGVLRVAAEPGTPPMLFSDGGQFDGFDYAIAKAVAGRIGVDDVVIVPGKYSQLPEKITTRKADVIISGYSADDSIAGLDWSDSYLDWGLCLIVKRGSGITSTRDLRGKVVGIFDDPAAEDEVRGMRLGESRLDKLEDGYLDLLAAGKLDAFIYDFPYAQEEIRPFADRLAIVEFNLSRSSYNVGVPKGSGPLLKMVNAAIRELRASDEYGTLIRKYLGGVGPAPIVQVEKGEGVYTVKRGDTLSTIARANLGSPGRWSEIWTLNRGRVADPNLIQPGWEILIPMP